MRRLLNHLFLLGIIVLLGSCSKDDTTDPTPTPGATPINVKLSLEPAAVETRAIDEDAISDINIFFYSENGSLNSHFYFEEYAPSFTFQMQAGSYELYVVTNIHEDLGEMTKAELLEYKYWNFNMKSDIPMTASTQVNIFSDTTLPTLQVKRAAAKVAYTIMVDPSVSNTIKLRSVQFCNLPNSEVLFGTGVSSTSKSDYYDDDTIDISNAGDEFYTTAYILENCQGEVESITDQKDKSPENAPECATYMRIYADGKDKVLEYIVYLGENNTTNFDVRKNTKHTMSLVIKGENEIDNRVKAYDGLYYGHANCYICTSREITFAATPFRTSNSSNFVYTDIYAGAEYEAAKAELLWQDTKGLVESVALKNSMVTVKTSGLKGNAVIALYDKFGDIVWSFHIWCTDKPKTYEFAENQWDHVYTVMDRNLGATTEELGKLSSNGLYYQWGRKDPFIGAKYNGGKEDAEIYDFDNKSISIKKDKTTKYANIETAVANPLTFYCGANSDSWIDNKELWVRRLWGNLAVSWDNGTNLKGDRLETVKSVYDPCPADYKVAPNDFMLICTRSNFWYEQTVEGDCYYYGSYSDGWRFYFDGKGEDTSSIVNIPKGGHRVAGAADDSINGTMSGGRAAIWTSGYSDRYDEGGSVEIYLYRGEYYIRQSPGNRLNQGNNIRCVKE